MGFREHVPSEQIGSLEESQVVWMGCCLNFPGSEKQTEQSPLAQGRHHTSASYCPDQKLDEGHVGVRVGLGLMIFSERKVWKTVCLGAPVVRRGGLGGW